MTVLFKVGDRVPCKFLNAAGVVWSVVVVCAGVLAASGNVEFRFLHEGLTSVDEMELHATRGEFDLTKARVGEILEGTKTNQFHIYQGIGSVMSHGKRRLESIYADLHKCRGMLFSIANEAERRALISWIEEQVLEAPSKRRNGYEELDYHLSTDLILDDVSDVLWETTRNPMDVWSLWVHQRRRYREMAQVYLRELVAAKQEEEKLAKSTQYLSRRLMDVRVSELTPAEKDLWTRCKMRPELERRVWALEALVGNYNRWNVGEHGRKLDGGRLYERFKSLTPEQLKEIEDRVRTRDKE